MYQIEWVGSPNFRPGRNGRKPIAIVDHITAGLYPGCLVWMQNPKAQASAQYLITKKGRIFQLVKDEDTAWHAGAVNKPNWPLYDGTNPNQYTIGIEHEALAGEGLTEEQFKASAWLHDLLVKKWSIPVDSNRIIGHYRIDSVNRPNDPGPKFPWDSLFRILRKDAAPTKPAIPSKPEIPKGDNITPFNGGYGWIEVLPERIIYHYDHHTYWCQWHDGRFTIHAKDKPVREI